MTGVSPESRPDTVAIRADAADGRVVGPTTLTALCDDLDTAESEVERLRERAEDFEGRYETSHANYMHALKVIERTEKALGTATGRADELEARIKALADEWRGTPSLRAPATRYADDLRAVLDGTDPTDPRADAWDEGKHVGLWLNGNDLPHDDPRQVVPNPYRADETPQEKP